VEKYQKRMIDPGSDRVSARLDRFENAWYSPGRSLAWQMLWFWAGLPLLRCAILPGSGFRSLLLRGFGAKVGRGVVIKPGVRVKYPWLLSIGDHSWIGEDAWIDNLALVTIGAHTCLSQGVYLCTGNHDWTSPHFDLRVGPIQIGHSAWVGAKAIVLPDVTIGDGAILAAGGVAAKSIPPWEIHSGNPAAFRRKREMNQGSVD
jgi:putative colanic acid biosynthesis acetyltransferase WcaF